MTLEKTPFRSYNLGEDKPDIITVRINKEERAIIEEIKEDLNIKADGKALKIGAMIALNVLHGLLTRRVLKYLFKKERQKLTDFKNY